MLNKITASPIRSLLYYVATCLLIFSLVTSNPFETIGGIWVIITSPSTLITDYFSVAGMSAAFLNSALVSFFTLFLYDYTKITYNGSTIASFMLMAGFSLFGKNIFNIIPIFVGVYAYALFNKETFRKHIYTALFGSSIAPVVSEVMVRFSPDGITLQSIVAGVAIGIGAGFMLPALSVECLRILQGFNLYNTGFAAGLIGILFTSAAKSFQYDTSTRLIWTYGRSPLLCIFLFVLFASFILFGFLLNGKSFRGYAKVFRHSGRAVADFTIMDGTAITFINMGVVSLFSLFYLIVLEGDINGPTIGAVFTVLGFGAMGKHLKNMIPPMIGVIVISLIADWSLTDPSVQLAALFCTGLAPIAGQFGPGWGVAAGMLHSVMVLSVTSFHGGLNLYNNGFAAGLVVIILLPMISSLSKEN